MSDASLSPAPPASRAERGGILRLVRPLYVQVLIGIALGTLVGALWPEFGQALKPLGDGFIKLIKFIIAPVIFCTVAAGIAQMGDIKKFGRVGGKALLYFEVVSFLALLIGLAMGYLVGPGRGFGMDPKALDPSIAASYVKQAAHGTGFVDHLMHIIPDTFFAAFASGDVLQVLFAAILTGFACSRLGEMGAKVSRGLDQAGHVFFSIIHIVVHAAPIGAFGAMAFTIGKYGLASLLPLGTLVATFYIAAAIFVLGVLGLIARWSGFSLLRFLGYIREELLIVLGAASSEAVLPQIMEKLERLGVSKPIVGLVVPTGYSFNPDGSSIYMTLAALFLAQATGTELSAVQMATLLGVAMLTSKGASGVTGAGFIGLAATLAVVPDIPIQSLALLVGVDRFMSAGRALVNLIGNGVATLVVARWENELDMEQLRAELARGPAQAEAARDDEAL